MTPVLYNTPEECCACQACSNVCPQKAISFKEDQYGFMFPVVDESLCINCGKCEKVCNFHNDTFDFKKNPIKGYAATLRNRDILKRSTSGGVFWALAEWIIKKGGCVFGCVWDEEMNPIHTWGETIEQLRPMQGSKYVQSDVGDIYQQVKKKLDENRFVLFSGTPCQVAALQSVLNNKNYDRLVTIDLICHGVPNNKFFHQYLSVLEKEYKGKVVDFHFRHKRPDWLNECIWIKIKKGNRFFTKELFHMESLYHKLFASKNQSCRLSCSMCKYSCPERVGDITIGDFWGFQRLDIKLRYQDGLSCILANNTKMLPIIEELNLNLQEVPIEQIIKGNGPLRHPNYKDKNWENIMEASSKGEFETLMDDFAKQNYLLIRKCHIKKILPPKLLIYLQKIRNGF